MDIRPQALIWSRHSPTEVNSFATIHNRHIIHVISWQNPMPKTCKAPLCASHMVNIPLPTTYVNVYSVNLHKPGGQLTDYLDWNYKKNDWNHFHLKIFLLHKQMVCDMIHISTWQFICQTYHEHHIKHFSHAGRFAGDFTENGDGERTRNSCIFMIRQV